MILIDFDSIYTLKWFHHLFQFVSELCFYERRLVSFLFVLTIIWVLIDVLSQVKEAYAKFFLCYFDDQIGKIVMLKFEWNTHFLQIVKINMFSKNAKNLAKTTKITKFCCFLKKKNIFITILQKIGGNVRNWLVSPHEWGSLIS